MGGFSAELHSMAVMFRLRLIINVQVSKHSQISGWRRGLYIRPEGRFLYKQATSPSPHLERRIGLCVPRHVQKIDRISMMDYG